MQVGLGHWECRKCGEAINGRKWCESGSKDDRKYVGLLCHDFRRSAARSYRRAGVAESVIMDMCGWDKDCVEAVAAREQKRITEISEREAEISHDFSHDSPVLAKTAERKQTAKAAN